MSELDWKPLANQSEHEEPWCRFCNDYCSPSDGSCRCCLAAEVEALREERDALKHDYDKSAAQVQRVREEVNGDQPIPRASDDLDNVAAYCAGYVDALRRVRRALEGDA